MKMRDYLQKYGFSVRYMAEACRISPSSVSNICQGTVPRSVVAKKIVNFSHGEISYEDLGYIRLNNNIFRTKGNVPKKKRQQVRG